MESYTKLKDKLDEMDGVKEENIVTSIMSDLPLSGQAKQVSESAVYVGLSGGGANIGIFLPRGSTLILICAENKDDFVMFNHMAHVTVKWIEVRDINIPPSQFPFQKVQELVEEGLQRYRDFHDCDDPDTTLAQDIVDVIPPPSRVFTHAENVNANKVGAGKDMIQGVAVDV